MNREEIEEEASERHLHERPREPLVSGSTIITIGVTTFINLVLLAFSYGTMFKSVDGLEDDVRSLKGVQITPGAAQRIAVLEAQVAQQRSDALDWRRDIREQLDRIEAKVDAHMAAERK